MYLLDTNIVIFLFKNFSAVMKRIEKNRDDCAISEITLAELKFGVENSDRRELRLKELNVFVKHIEVLSISDSLDVFAKEKARLRKNGTMIPDFDLLIGATAVANNLILVTNNTKHFERIDGIKLEDWTK